MSRKDMYVAKTEELILPILEEYNFELVDVEYVRSGSDWYLNVYIDKDGGITIDDCEKVSRRMNDILDREDYISDPYTFVVSSPGLDRPLKKEKDYVRNMGKLIEIHTYRTIDKQKQFVGILTAYDDESVTIQDDSGSEITIQRQDISVIRQAIDF